MLEDDGTKWLRAARLIELLAELPADSRVMVNIVANLLVLSADGTHRVAYIDFNEECVESMMENPTD